MATRLAEPAADALVREDDWGGKAGAFDRIAGCVEFWMNAHELDGAIACGVAFIDAELTCLLPSEREAIGLDPGEAHASHALFFDGQRANRAGGAHLAAVVAGRFATSPVGY